MSTASSLLPLVSPRGIAVVGASPRESNVGGRLVAALREHDFPGDLAVVNPTVDEVFGVPSHASFADLPFAVDLVLVALAAARVEETLRSAADAGARAAIVYSSGFAETGAAGHEAQQRLGALARELGIRVLGPNCQGLVDFGAGLAACFAPAVLRADPRHLAPVAYVGQSGAVGGTFFDLARERGRTPAVWASTGNEVDVSVVELARELAARGDLDLLCLYLENIPDGATWFDLLDRAAGSGTRLAVLRSGETEVGRRAAESHTGALLSDATSFEISCRDAGVLRVRDVSELVDLAVSVRRRPPNRRGIAVVTTSGGAGGLAADRLAEAGLEVPALGERTTEALTALLPSFAGLANPVDVTAEFMVKQAANLPRVTDALLADEAVDDLLVILTNVVGTMADDVAAAFAGSGEKSITFAYLAAGDESAAASRVLRAHGLAVHGSIASAVRAIALCRVPQAPAPRVERGPAVALPAGFGSTTEWGARELLVRAQVPHPAARLARSADEASAHARAIGGPVVLKIQSPDVLHKTDVGGVRVGVSAAEADDVAAEILDTVTRLRPDAAIEGVLVQEMAPRGVELLVGLRAGVDGYPATVTVGIGGTAVEVYGDVATAFAPVTPERAEQLLLSLEGAPLLTGARGKAPADVTAAAEAVSRLSGLVEYGAIAEVEVNPLVALDDGKGALALDLLVRLTGA
ncbi:acetate--CoA ligase family protein [Pseudonocardia ailaonensis]|uniref:Acetate--CoA ligase family protein n=1 Tax=Pseudonocardia ailaonensis TaxID=367279 RepID=A0ABN2NGV2_9PSEU